MRTKNTSKILMSGDRPASWGEKKMAGGAVKRSIYLMGSSDYNNPALSIFKTDIFQCYGSGRFDFEIVPLFDPCDLNWENDTPTKITIMMAPVLQLVGVTPPSYAAPARLWQLYRFVFCIMG